VAKKTTTVPYALTTSPGHHAGYSYFGGFCYLNNAMYAATAIIEGLGEGSTDRVGILDIDMHFGNGTNGILIRAPHPRISAYSIHISPELDYPHFPEIYGEHHGGESFEGQCTYEQYSQLLERAKRWMTERNVKWLVVAFGTDILHTDPEVPPHARTQLAVRDIRNIGTEISLWELPTMVVQEGGYDLNSVGPAVTAFLTALSF
jgi:acetoin utilization deacetylase AcuC-like enzyme